MNITALTVIGSSACNFDCKFCYLHKNQAYHYYNQELVKAWKNKTYISNIKKVFNKLSLDNQNVTKISIWGGESLLNLKNITTNIVDFYNFFPNIEQFLISTNFSTNIEDLVNFIKTIDDTTSKKTTFVLQLSIDGPPGEISEMGHNGWDKYIDNLILFNNLFLNKPLKNVSVDICIHPTIHKDIYFTKFLDKSYLQYYMTYMYDLGQKIKSLCPKNVSFHQDIIYPNITTPYEYTAEDGINFVKILKNWDLVYDLYFKDKNVKNHSLYAGIFGSKYTNRSLLWANGQCSQLYSELTINYDGSIAECNGSFISNFSKYTDELLNNNENHLYLEAKVHNNMTNYNPLICDEKTLNKYQWAVHNGGYKRTETTYLQSTIMLANQLALSGQIAPQYKNNYELLLRHCSLLSKITSCCRNNIQETYMPYFIPVGALRLYLNGAVDYMETSYKINRIKQV